MGSYRDSQINASRYILQVCDCSLLTKAFTNGRMAAKEDSSNDDRGVQSRQPVLEEDPVAINECHEHGEFWARHQTA